MVVVRLRGVHSATKRLAGGRRVTYYYAWKGGPRLHGAPGSPEFVAGYQEAHQSRKRPEARSLARLVAMYLDSPEFRGRADSTRKEWRRWCDLIREDDIGALPAPALEDSKVRRHFVAWRNKWAETPRAADYAVQVLSRVLSWAIEAGEIENNFALKISKLYEGDRAEVIWTEDEIARFIIGAPSTEVAFIVPLACLTGLRREDLASLKWLEVGALAIVKPTSKSRGRKTATVPLLPETRALLDTIRTHRPGADYVLTNTRGDQWTPSGLSHAVGGFGGKRLHDCRGTFATTLRLAGLTGPQIADIMGWEEARVERLLSVYVDREAIVRDIAERLGRSER